MQEASAAIEQINGYKLDKNHVFKARPPLPFARASAGTRLPPLLPRARLAHSKLTLISPQVTPLGAFDKVASVPDDYVAPEEKEAIPKEDEIHQWLMDERGRDQFAIRFAEETEVYWNDAHQAKPDEVYRRSCWTESYVQWSTRGHYIATIHRQGAALWGGPQFPRLQRFAHPGVQFLDFSPYEKYLVTGSIRDPTNARESTTITVRAPRRSIPGGGVLLRRAYAQTRRPPHGALQPCDCVVCRAWGPHACDSSLRVESPLPATLTCSCFLLRFCHLPFPRCDSSTSVAGARL